MIGYHGIGGSHRGRPGSGGCEKMLLKWTLNLIYLVNRFLPEGTAEGMLVDLDVERPAVGEAVVVGEGLWELEAGK